MTTFINDDGSVTANAAPAMTKAPEEIAAGLTEALEEVRAKAGLARLFHAYDDATDRALADIIQFINAVLQSQEPQP